jgi:hypothetical protein
VQIGEDELVEKLLLVTGREFEIKEFSDRVTLNRGNGQNFSVPVYGKICT